MKILHIADEPWDSGLTEYAIALACAQRKAGDEALFAAKAGSHAYARCKKLGLEPLAYEGFISGFLMLKTALRGFRPDIINAHTGAAHTLASAALRLYSGKTALLRTRADARPFRLKPCYRLTWSNTAGFIAANSSIAADFNRAKPAAIPCETIFQGVAAPAPVVDGSEKGLNSPVLGIVARLDPVKGHSVAIDAMPAILKQFPGATLKIAGEEKNIKYARLEAQCAALGITGRVRFAGYVPDVFAFMSGCDIGLIPSTGSEAVSRAAVEWLSQGVPVIASPVGCLPDLLKDSAAGGLAETANPAAIAKAAAGLLSDRQALRRAGEAARKLYLENFTPEKFAAKTRAFYEKIIRGIPS